MVSYLYRIHHLHCHHQKAVRWTIHHAANVLISRIYVTSQRTKKRSESLKSVVFLHVESRVHVKIHGRGELLRSSKRKKRASETHMSQGAPSLKWNIRKNLTEVYKTGVIGVWSPRAPSSLCQTLSVMILWNIHNDALHLVLRIPIS